MLILFPWPAILALALAVLAMTVLAYRNHCTVATLRAQLDQALERSKPRYQQGYEDGLLTGHRRGYSEAEIRARKAGTYDEGYQKGWEDASASLAEFEQTSQGRAAHAVPAA